MTKRGAGFLTYNPNLFFGLNLLIFIALLYVLWAVIYPKVKHNTLYIIILSLVTVWLVYYHLSEIMAIITIPISYLIGPNF